MTDAFRQVSSRYERELTCRWCDVRFTSRRKRRSHPCPDRDAAQRTNALRWPITPVERHLLMRLGAFDQNTNLNGYCPAAVERLTGLKASTWKDLAANRGTLTDSQADRVATRLGVPPVAFWPTWYAALDITDEDYTWLDRWARGRTG